MNKYLVTLIVLLTWVTFSHAATPTISNVTGTIATGQTITITGTNMLQESTTNWIALFQSGTAYGFEGTTADYDYAGSPSTYVSDVKLMGSQSVRFNASGASASCPTDNLMGGTMYFGGGSASDYWIRGYVRWNSADNSWATSHTKMWELMYSPTPNTYIQPGNGPTAPSTMRIIHTAADGYRNFPSGAIENDRWYLIEAHVTNTAVVLYIDNEEMASYEKTANNLTTFVFGLINVCGTSAGFNLYHWQDGLTISSSRVYPASTIEVSGDGGSTWHYQEPVFLSETSSQVKLNLPAGASFLLRVTNNSQETSTNYALGGDTTPPSTTITTGSPIASSTGSATIEGTATDDTAVTGVKCRIGAEPDANNGTACTGTTSWSCAVSGLASGSNTVYCEAYDAAGNYDSGNTITANYTPPTATVTGVTFTGVNWQ